MDNHSNSNSVDEGGEERVMGQIKFVTSILFIAIFTIAIVSYVTIWGFDNNAATNLADSSSFVTVNSSLQGDMTVFVDGVNSTSEGFTQSTIETGSDTLKSPSVFQNLGMTRRTIGSILRLMREQVFGNNPAFFVVIGSISTFMVFVAVSYIWKTFKGGDPD